jgi:hypothetical protein
MSFGNGTPRSLMVRSASGSALALSARVSNHLAYCLRPSFETPREARAAPQDEVWVLGAYSA